MLWRNVAQAFRPVYFLFLCVVVCAAQPPAPTRTPRNAYPDRPAADPAAIERGKALFGVHCAFCHGADARGGEGGPSLLRSQLVLNDQSGELIAPVVQNGRPDAGMPKINLTAAQVSDVAAFVHSFKVGGYDPARQKPLSIVVGDPKAGQAYFNAHCASCHSVTGDLKDFAAKFSEPRAMQQYWMMPGRGGRGGGGASELGAHLQPTTVTITLTSGQKVEGRLVRIDDFLVTLTDADGNNRTFRRDDENSPKVEIHDPLEPHLKMIPLYRDKDIHDVTAYLQQLSSNSK